MSTSFVTAAKQNDLPTPPATAQTLAIAEGSPELHNIAPTPGRLAPDSAADLALMKDLRAEMRVNAAIQVAVDSLEFAEGQLRIVKEVNRLKGGSTSQPNSLQPCCGAQANTPQASTSSSATSTKATTAFYSAPLSWRGENSTPRPMPRA
jgi:hypothetical protein